MEKLISKKFKVIKKVCDECFYDKNCKNCGGKGFTLITIKKINSEVR